MLGELAEHGATRAIRLGVAVALEPHLAPGDCVVVAAAPAGDGASRALGADAPRPDPELTRALAARLPADPHTVASFDLWQHPADAEHRHGWRAAGAVAGDLESAATLALGARLGLAVAAGLVIEEASDGERDHESTQAALLGLADAGAAALAESAQPSPVGR